MPRGQVDDVHCVPGGDKPLRMCARCTPHVQKAGWRGRQVAKQDLLGAKEFQFTQAGRETVLFSVGLVVLDNGCCLIIIHRTTVLSPTRRSAANSHMGCDGGLVLMLIDALRQGLQSQD
jgi:hypothetical protein